MLSRKMQRASVVKWSHPDHHFDIATSSRCHDAHSLGYTQGLEALPNHCVGVLSWLAQMWTTKKVSGDTPLVKGQD
jgi:hypothetical protein